MDFLRGGGDMGELTRTYDWANSSLGPPDTWPQSLRVTVRLMLNSGHPMFIWWGPDLIQFYNDACCRIMGPERHPSALGQKGRECWSEIWPIIGPMIEFVMAGKGATWDEERLVPVTRHGKLEQVWWTFSYGPIDLEDGVGGVLVVCNDVTKQHLAREELKLRSEQLEYLFEHSPNFFALLRGRDHVFQLGNAAYKRLIGETREFIGKRVRDALPDIAGQGFFELLDEVYRTGAPHVGKQTSVTFKDGTGGQDRQCFVDFLYAPVLNEAGEVTGIFVDGHDVTTHVMGERHLRLMNNELKHRVKNTLSMVGAIAAQSLRGAEKEASTTFQKRLEAFGRAHDVLTNEAWATATVGDVVSIALRPHKDSSRRFAIDGPPIVISAKHTIALTLALHELATNAAKYGALSVEDGQIGIAWAIAGSPEGKSLFTFTWKEHGGPKVGRPVRQGFGTQIVERVLPSEFEGEVHVDFEPDGLRFRLQTEMAKLRNSMNELL
jgi:two-component sensor histidine kinase